MTRWPSGIRTGRRARPSPSLSVVGFPLEVDFVEIGPAAVGALGRFEDHRDGYEAGVAHDVGEAAFADLALPMCSCRSTREPSARFESFM